MMGVHAAVATVKGQQARGVRALARVVRGTIDRLDGRVAGLFLGAGPLDEEDLGDLAMVARCERTASAGSSPE